MPKERLLAQLIVVCRASGRALLGRHKSGRWQGFYTGFLDEVRPGEDPAEAAARIAREQAGIAAGPIKHRATFVFVSEAWGRARELEFIAESHSGEPAESETVVPEWFAFDAIPYDRMPAYDAIWYPSLLAGKKMRGHFDFAPDGQTLLAHRIEDVEPSAIP
jgi:8-oxo-dGTP diphosphatase